MSVTNVYHKSREASFTLNFSATENNLSWAFTAENDGEIYEVALTNIVSYTVAGSAITLPYALTGATSYAVSIIKTSNGQPASITLKTRRALNKSSNIIVPDFGQYDGRYTYAIHTNNTIEIFDSSLFTNTNYLGAGVFTTTPKIATIALPSLPADSLWTIAEFVIISNVAYFLVLGAKEDAHDMFACRVAVGSWLVTDMVGIAGGYTKINPTATYRHGLVHNCVYDYINNLLYITRVWGYNGAQHFVLNLSTLDFIVNPGPVSASVELSSNINGVKHYFDPLLERILTWQTEFSFNPFKSHYYWYLSTSVLAKGFIYRKLDGYRYRQYWQNSRLNYFDIVNQDGLIVASKSNNVVTVNRVRGMQLVEPYIFQYELNSVGKYIALFNLNTNIGALHEVTTELPENTVGFMDACVSEYNNEVHLFLLTRENVSGTFSRLYRIYFDGTTWSKIYFDLGGVASDIGNNRLLT